jgi:hypothetical protein
MLIFVRIFFGSSQFLLPTRRELGNGMKNQVMTRFREKKEDVFLFCSFFDRQIPSITSCTIKSYASKKEFDPHTCGG